MWLCRFGTAVGLCAWLGQVGAVEPYQEYNKRIQTAQNMTALKNDLFGESISLYNGKTDFSVSDVDLPGNNSLPVRLSRRFSVELHLTGTASTFNANLEGAGGWDIDVPHISGTFPSAGSSWADTRCSGEMVPSVSTQFYLTDIWQGNTIHIPGAGDRTMLALEANTPRPSDGISHKWTSSQRDGIDCIPMVSGLPGEGYRVTTTDGVRYSFNQAVGRLAGVLRKTLGSGGLAQTSRTKIYLLATKVEDRFGNWVQYQYNGDGHPTRIWSSDGREITLTYSGANLSTASANGRTWSYGYGTVTGSIGSQTRLTSVTLPDGSQWTYSYSNGLDPSFVAWDGNSTSNCAEQPPEAGWNFVLTATHPSGATGTFSFANSRHYRSGVHMSACLERVNNSGSGVPENNYFYELSTPNFFDVVSLYGKTISGPGITTPLNWAYSYGGGYQPLYGNRGTPSTYPCASCPPEKETQVSNPDGTKVIYRYGFQYQLNEGRLLGSRTLDTAGNVVSSSSTTYMTKAQSEAQAFAPRYGIIYSGEDPSTARVEPVVSTVLQQDGATYQSTSSNFDSLARPLSVTKASPWASRTDVSEYYDDTAKWILNQPSKLTNSNTGLVVSQTSYNASAMPSQVWAFGKLQQTLTYNADGTVATVTDGGNHTTTLASWKRGSPQSITYADTTTMAAVVNDNGWITSVTDENGYVSNYGYDAMGRIASIAYPTGDSVAWNPTTQAFAQVPGVEYGLGAGHWRQTVSTGNAYKETYFDALWRPIVTREYDNANVAGTLRFQRFAYDEDGRQIFASYPGTTDGLNTGNWSDYDALGRPISASQDSELGLLTTTTSYGSAGGYNTLVTNPRSQQTRTWFQTFDAPNTERPSMISAPEGATTEIGRNVFGKPTSIRRRNADSTLSVTRSYVYDSYQQLCKTVEPETGATASAYDGAGNVIWSAAGLSLTSTSNCDAQSAYDSGRRVDRTYDPRNRLKTLVFPDANGNQSWDYFSDGKPSQVVTKNDQGNSDTVNTYTYNKRRLLTAETTAQVGWFTWSLGYGYDANGSLANTTYPSGLAVNYMPNALGQPTQAGGYATGVSYYPNGGMKQFTYGNGIVHTMTQNARQLPAQVTDSNNALSNGYSYDANGNVSQITDGLNAGRNRSMQYDGLDRLTQATSASFGGDGIYRYTYDALDNIRSAKLSGIKQHNYFYDTSNRLTNVQNDGGATTVGLSYDVQGNLNNKSGQAFGFDYGNRLRNVPGKTSYRYDAQGRRSVVSESTGANIVSMYGQDGALRRQDNSREGKNYEYIQLNGSLVAKVTTVVAPVTPALTVPSYSGTGSYTVSWNSVAYANGYELQEQTNGGAWGAKYTGTALSAAVTGKTGGTYGYRIRACQGAACSGWSVTANAVVQLPPSATTSISLAGQSPNGSFTVSWGAIAGAATHKLEESVNGGAWAVAQDTAATAAGFSAKLAGTYAYRVSGCNPAGCGPISASATTQSYYPPGAAPSIAGGGQSFGGSYTVSWGAVGGASTYRLEESTNGSGWTLVVNAASQSQGFSGKSTGNYSYRAQGCNGAGCGPYSGNATVEVIQPPGVPSLSVPSSNSTGNYAVSWTAVPMTVVYNMEQNANNAGWVMLQSEGSTTRNLAGVLLGTYEYRVKACNAAGCGGYSNVGTIVVTPPPPTPAFITDTKFQWKQGTLTKIRCDVEWTASPGATSYNLVVAANGLVQYNGPLTKISAQSAAYCAPSHVIRACNASGCSADSPPRTQGFVDLDNPQ
jgi:YD repeat-containing protein